MPIKPSDGAFDDLYRLGPRCTSGMSALDELFYRSDRVAGTRTVGRA